jgi:hypothetical protein
MLGRPSLSPLEAGNVSTRVPTPVRDGAVAATSEPAPSRRLPPRQDNPQGAAGGCAGDDPLWSGPLSGRVWPC